MISVDGCGLSPVMGASPACLVGCGSTLQATPRDTCRCGAHRTGALSPATRSSRRNRNLRMPSRRRRAALRSALHELAANFDIVAVPARGTYVERPATAKDGTAYDGP